ncbi:hypothetical protein GSI_06618 [Ganoderma sinense ZZ0214-1]|uniref:Uncharacterized protein n=1 Tax=Ganoderma sinense ZZ0214-1 TaxID=1077348 RepID=A0A2G8SDR1_9APHY|nr:hypothetical protein GSI_06618 [Ganoderma sinense ZZ0214-1]
MESRYKAIQDTKSIVELLDRSRSAQSRTNTTSSAPSPSLAPATIAFSAASNQIIDLLHSQMADPNALFYMNARSESELKSLAKQLLPFLVGRRDTLSRLVSESNTGAIHVSEKTKAFWQVKKIATDKFLQVFEHAQKNGAELADEERQRREEYLESSQAAWTALKDVLATLDSTVLGPYTLASEDGTKVLGRIEAHVGNGFTLPEEFSVAEARRRAGLPAVNVESSERQSKLAAFWDSMRERPSWKKVYGEGLH